MKNLYKVNSLNHLRSLNSIIYNLITINEPTEGKASGMKELGIINLLSLSTS